MTRQLKTAGERLRLKIELLQLADELGNISEACRRTGCSRDSYYRYKRRFDAGGMAALASAPPRASAPPGHSESDVENAILAEVRLDPGRGRLMVSKILHKKGISVSASGVRLVWLRFGLETAAKREAWVASQAGGAQDRWSPGDRRKPPGSYCAADGFGHQDCCPPATGPLSEIDLTSKALAYPGQALKRKCEG
jgi:transposase